jgi:EAL domain-containing protein (putative c-di-GMP-specific phosphodiesterase class I)
VVENQPVQALSRLSGGDFAFFLGTENDEVADRLADSLSNELATLHHSEFFDGPQLAKLGVATIHKPLSYGKALTRADSALRMAQSKAASSWIRVSELDASDIHSMSRNEWNQHITQCVENADFNLLGQTVVAGSDTGAVLHREVFLQMVDKASQSIPAARFIATCNELRLSASIDRKVIAELIKQLKTRRSSERYAINLSSQSIEGPELVTWLREELAACGDEASDIASHLIFEFSESTVVEHLGELRAFSAAIRELGCGLGVDQFGKTFADFAYLNSIRPDYVKIDQVYTHELLEDQDAQFFVKSLCGICRSLDIAVIAQAVESEEQAATLTAAGVSGLQGYSIERPVPLDLSR